MTEIDPDKEDVFVNSYINTAIWSSTDDRGEPLDAGYSVVDIDSATLQRMASDARRFLRENFRDIGNRLARAGHDFWLTRNRHGAGFWDGDWPEPAATRLTGNAHAYGEYGLYVGDDGMIYGTEG